MKDSRLSLERIEEASRTIDPVFLNSPQFESESLSDELGMRLILKVETVNCAHRLGDAANAARVIRRNDRSDTKRPL